MNKKLVYLFAVLVLGLFVISSCQQNAVGRKVVNRNAVGDNNIGQGNLQAQQVDIGGSSNVGGRSLMTLLCDSNSGHGWDVGGSTYDLKCTFTCSDGTTRTTYVNGNLDGIVGSYQDDCSARHGG